MSRRLSAAAAACLAFLAPALAAACPVCGAGQNDAARQAFIGSTIFLSLLPLSLIGGLIGWAVWRVRRQEREQAEEQAQARTTESTLSAAPSR